jgi:hypothetical protein
VHHVAGIDQAHTRDAIDGRADVRIVQHQLGLLDLRLIGFHRTFQLSDQNALVIRLLLRDELVLGYAGVALEVDLAALQLCLIAGQSTLGLMELDSIVTRIDERQEGSALDELALLKGHAVQATIHLGSDGHGLVGGHRAEPVESHRHVARNDLGCDHGHRALVTTAARGLAP